MSQKLISKMLSGKVVYSDKADKIIKLAQSGSIKPIIEATFTLDQIKDAHARIDKGHKRGNFIVKFRQWPK